jgi:hypothetical protein
VAAPCAETASMHKPLVRPPVPAGGRSRMRGKNCRTQQTSHLRYPKRNKPEVIRASACVKPETPCHCRGTRC